LIWVPAVRRAVPALAGRWRPVWRGNRPLLTFGAWVALANAANPLLRYLDRLALGGVSLSAVALYAAPQEIISRLSLIPAIIMPPVFAASSAAQAAAPGAVTRLASATLRLLLVVLVPLACALWLLATPGLAWWLGAEFAGAGAVVVPLLLVSAVASGVAQLPGALLQAHGRPDVHARLQLIEVPFYGVALWVLISRYGLAGAALATALRAVADALALWVLAWRVQPDVIGPALRAGVARALPALLVVTGITWVAFRVTEGLAARLAAAVLLGLIGTGLAWYTALTPDERTRLGAA
ncbi:MAG: polysaccharide biosynthesis C-terminal domain-containing protein, partial [Gemmatimonadales bacterium]